MKHIKTFESSNNEIKVGDWVAIKQSASSSEVYKYFLNIPCKVVARDASTTDDYGIKLRGREKELWWRIDDMEYYSPNKEDVEIYLQSRKYNL